MPQPAAGGAQTPTDSCGDTARSPDFSRFSDNGKPSISPILQIIIATEQCTQKTVIFYQFERESAAANNGRQIAPPTL
jgi:hypothetical protein